METNMIDVTLKSDTLYHHHLLSISIKLIDPVRTFSLEPPPIKEDELPPIPDWCISKDTELPIIDYNNIKDWCQIPF